MLVMKEDGSDFEVGLRSARWRGWTASG